MGVSKRYDGRKDRQARYKKGWLSEWVAGGYLMLKGYAILNWRYRSAAGEIDLIARRGALISFVEVKARPDFDAALWAVNRRQKDRMFRAAELWMQKNVGYKDYERSFDLIAVVSWRGVQHHKQFFTW